MSNRARLISLGFNNVVRLERIVAVVNAQDRPIKRLIAAAKKANRLIDATSGRKTRCVVVTDSEHLILSALQPPTLAERIEGE